MNNSTSREDGSLFVLQQDLVPLLTGLLISATNTLALIILFKCKKMNYQIKLMSTNLAVTDLVAGLTILGDSVLAPALPEGLCRPLLYLYSLSVIASFLTITGMLVDRFVSLYYPFQYNYFFRRERWPAILAGIWLAGIVLTLVNYYDGFAVYEVRSTFICANSVMVGKSGLAIVTVIFCLLVIVNSLLYLFMYIKIYKMSQLTIIFPYQQRSLKSHSKILFKLSAITGSFMCLYLPQILLNVVGLFITAAPSMQRTFLTMQSFAGFLILFNSFINPFLYVWWFTECRYTFLMMVCRCNKKRWKQYENYKKQFYVSFLDVSNSSTT